MNLVGYTATALSRNDIEDTPTNKNVVDFAIVELKDLQGDLVTIYDDAEGTNPETQKTCNSDGQVTFFAEIGDYDLEINGKAQRINLSSGLAEFISTKTDESVQGFIDSFALKIFQSPTDGGLTEIQTRTVDSGEVYEVRKTSDDSLATIYSDAIGAAEIVQNGTNNISGSDGVVEFYIDDGDYYVEVNSMKGGFTVTYLKDNSISDGIAANLLVKNRGEDSATRVHIEPNGVIYSGTVSKQDWMFDDYNADLVNYRILGHFLQNGDLSGNGRNAEANVTLKSAGGFYGNFPLMMWGYQDNNADQSISMKMLYMDVNETEKPTPHLGRWESGRAVVVGDYIQSNNFDALPRPTYGLYKASTSGVTGDTQPTHLSGSVSDGGVTWEFVKDYFITAQSKDLHSMMLFGRKSDYPVAGGHEYTAQFARGLGIHQGRDLALFDADGSLSGRRLAIGSDIYDYFKGGTHLYKHTDTYSQHIGGGTIRSIKSITEGDGQSNISVDVRGVDTVNLAFTQPTSIVQFICDANQEFRVRVQNDNVVTLVDSGSMRLISGTQLLGVRAVVSFYARTINQAIQDGYTGS